MGRRKPAVPNEVKIKLFVAKVLILGPVVCYPHTETWKHFLDRHDKGYFTNPNKLFEISGLLHKKAARPKSGINELMAVMLSDWGSRPQNYIIYIEEMAAPPPPPPPRPILPIFLGVRRPEVVQLQRLRTIPTMPETVARRIEVAVQQPLPPHQLQIEPQPSTSRITVTVPQSSIPVPPKKRLLPSLNHDESAPKPIPKKKQNSENVVEPTAAPGMKSPLQNLNPGHRCKVLGEASPPTADTPDNMHLLANTASSRSPIRSQYSNMEQAQQRGPIYQPGLLPERHEMSQGQGHYHYNPYLYPPQNLVPNLKKAEMPTASNSGRSPTSTMRSPPRGETPRMRPMTRSSPRRVENFGMFYPPGYGNAENLSRLEWQSQILENTGGYEVTPQQNNGRNGHEQPLQLEGARGYYDGEDQEGDTPPPNSSPERPPRLFSPPVRALRVPPPEPQKPSTSKGTFENRFLRR
ncbi:unnamed protein product [Orchesella dallaii]|uniref:Uncharacterized protein n=1 Tax=Orchesella dallaii TaxID=48710 RepID=A0ABP1RZX5_9HEXA